MFVGAINHSDKTEMGADECYTTLDIEEHSVKFKVDTSSQVNIKTHGSESRGQGGSSKQRPDGLETHTREYYTGTRVVKIENAITKEP